MSRILWWLVGVPVGIVLVALAVANRAPVKLSLDPFRPDAPALSVELPLYLIFFAVLMIGVVIGGVAVWLNQGRHRRSERRLRAETERLLGEREASAERDREARRAALALSGPGRRAA
ncbi:lipopolysaccharide assembly protein LapA domain-containing protein [Prosthecomicrobium hirschii]|uniref:lipopolysaccharide assembly protein LapA domain-containing protein n=1 Tax=Prosthecodimorpha hirschii TaxID=665126 RepID=UPI0009F8FF03|nr:lipopolysaccharide assembly protein LapA domain-containing protein [Prosthecomicrobium hirschii]MCW1842155.1 lipopolysaccharide assembly protein LapA domain-containing protein [Prosthecomicrobium hirschii]TPQ49274.1 DUF1049 domain-containing protein [Prosthecomicrobium hirschii]